METGWLIFSGWAIWLTTLFAVLGLIAIAGELRPAQEFRRHPRMSRPGFRAATLFWSFAPLAKKAVTFLAAIGTVAWLVSLTGH